MLKHEDTSSKVTPDRKPNDRLKEKSKLEKETLAFLESGNPKFRVDIEVDLVSQIRAKNDYASDANMLF